MRLLKKIALLKFKYRLIVIIIDLNYLFHYAFEIFASYT